MNRALSLRPSGAASAEAFNIPDALMVEEGPAGAPAVVIFGSVNSNGFSFYKLGQSLPYTKIYVRDPYDVWYQQGISPSVGSIEAMLEHLRAILDVLAPRRVVTMGSSMGGYAALLFAMELRAAAALACSPQTIIDPRLPHTPSKSFEGSQWYDLAPVLRPNFPGRPAFHILFGSDDIVDIWNASRLKLRHADCLYPIAGQDHLAAALVSSTGDLKRMLEALCEDRPISVVADLDQRYDEKRVRAIIDRLVRSIYMDEPDLEPELWARKLGKLEPDWAVPFDALATIEVRNGNPAVAEKAARRASDLAPRSITLATNHANLLMKLGMETEAIAGYEKCLRIRPKHYAALCNLGLLYARNGETEKATAKLQVAVEIRPRLPKARFILDLIESGDARRLKAESNPINIDM